jgi:hypothetical protein
MIVFDFVRVRLVSVLRQHNAPDLLVADRVTSRPRFVAPCESQRGGPASTPRSQHIRKQRSSPTRLMYSVVHQSGAEWPARRDKYRLCVPECRDSLTGLRKHELARDRINQVVNFEEIVCTAFSDGLRRGPD